MIGRDEKHDATLVKGEMRIRITHGWQNSVHSGHFEVMLSKLIRSGKHVANNLEENANVDS